MRSLTDLHWFGLLSLMWMLRPRIYLELGELLVSKAGVWEHPPHRPLYNDHRPALAQGAQALLFKTVRVAGVVAINLLLFLLTGDLDLLRIDDDHKITAIDMR